MTSSETDTMILIGQYDSPFVRRVALALRFYGLPFEHRPWSTFGDADKLAAFNPLRRGPAPGLGGGEAPIESTAIPDYLRELGGAGKAVDAARRRAAGRGGGSCGAGAGAALHGG